MCQCEGGWVVAMAKDTWLHCDAVSVESGLHCGGRFA